MTPSRLTPEEAARIAAVLPLPKRREAVDPAGFTRRYGNSDRGAHGRGRAATASTAASTR